MFRGIHLKIWRMASKMALCVGLFITPGIHAKAQTMQQVQAVVDGMVSPQHAAEANEVLREIPGVVMSRLDHYTSNLFMHVAPGTQVDAAMLTNALAPFGLTLRCFTRGEVGMGKFQHLDPDACDTAPVQVR